MLAAPSSRFGSLRRGAVALLVLLQAFVFPPAHALFSTALAHGDSGLAPSATYCASGQEAPATPPAPYAHPCVLCAAAAASGALPRIVAMLTAPPQPTTAPPLPSPPPLGRAPPGWASSWSSQAPPSAH